MIVPCVVCTNYRGLPFNWLEALNFQEILLCHLFVRTFLENRKLGMKGEPFFFHLSLRMPDCKSAGISPAGCNFVDWRSETRASTPARKRIKMLNGDLCVEPRWKGGCGACLLRGGCLPPNRPPVSPPAAPKSNRSHLKHYGRSGANFCCCCCQAVQSGWLCWNSKAWFPSGSQRFPREILRLHLLARIGLEKCPGG